MAGNQRIARLPVYVAPTKHAALTPRELQICELIGAAESNEVIAETFGLSINTVKNHVQNILNKLGMDNRAHVARWWLLERCMADERRNLKDRIATLEAENSVLRRQRDDWKMWCGV